MLRHAGGRTPKFYCALATGEVVPKGQHAGAIGQLHGEVIAARLLAALGFSADQMLVVRRVRCIGCPAAPFTTLRCLQQVGWTGVCAPGGFGSERIRTFAPAVIERRLPGRAIEASENQGWAWFELDRIDPAAGGAPPADVDALRLFAVLLGAIWDNKSSSALLPYLGDLAGGACAAPVAVMQDVGATFGPLKLDLPNWRATPIWQDAAAGGWSASMKSQPFAGGTFPDRQIWEGGRTALLRLLQRLSDAQLAVAFHRIRGQRHDAVNGEGRHAEAWNPVRSRDKARADLRRWPLPRRRYRVVCREMTPASTVCPVRLMASKGQLVTGDLHQDEAVVGIEALRGQGRALDIFGPQPPRRSGHEVADPVLRPDPLYRCSCPESTTSTSPSTRIGSITRRSDRASKWKGLAGRSGDGRRDLPGAARGRQLPLEPPQLIAVE